MDRWLRIGLVVAAAFAFTLISMSVGGSAAVADLSRTNPDAYSVIRYIALPARPGMVLADRWLHRGIFNEAFGPLSIAIDTLIYSALFALLRGLLRFIVGRAKRT